MGVVYVCSYPAASARLGKEVGMSVYKGKVVFLVVGQRVCVCVVCCRRFSLCVLKDRPCSLNIANLRGCLTSRIVCAAFGSSECEMGEAETGEVGTGPVRDSNRCSSPNSTHSLVRRYCLFLTS